LLEFINVSKTYQGVKAVDNLSMEIPQGVVFGLLGPNGAGKTTTIRMILNIIIPDSGAIRFQGGRNAAQMRTKIAYLPEERGLYQKSKVWDVLVFFGGLKGVKEPDLGKKISYWLERLDIAQYAQRSVFELSKGNQQKVQFAATVLNEPKLLILDEPFTGLDPINQRMLKEIIKELQQNGCSIILSTHQMEQVEQLCSHISLLNLGKLILHGPLADIKNQYGQQRVEIKFTDLPESVADNILKDQSYANGSLQGLMPEGMKSSALIKKIAERYEIERFTQYQASLEDIFIRLVKEKQDVAS
jgi:ABC-2 type transport system ATP-binding protein